MLTSPPVFTLLCLLSMVQAEVVPNFQQCWGYFYKGQVPALGVPVVGVAGTHICQLYENRTKSCIVSVLNHNQSNISQTTSYHFATLYDTQHRIPVYSAYIFQPGNGLGRPSTWFVEPQLVKSCWPKKMMYESQCPDKNKALLGQNQALDEDYDNLHNVYHRGHLNPYSHNRPGYSAKATFTLTNAVPQVGAINTGVWRVYEGKLYTLLSKCSEAYVVVGAIPSKNNWINARVNVPDYLWSAYCCLDNNGKPIGSGAALVKNKKGAKVQEGSLDQLVHFLRSLSYFSAVGDIFNKNCK